jgi:hypothetical protein
VSILNRIATQPSDKRWVFRSQFYILSGAETPNNVKPLRMTF